MVRTLKHSLLASMITFSCHLNPPSSSFLGFFSVLMPFRAGFLPAPCACRVILTFYTLLNEEPTDSHGFICRICQKLCILPMLCPQLQILYPVVFQIAWFRHPKKPNIWLFKNEFFISTHTIACFWGYLMQECPPLNLTCHQLLFMFSVVIFWLPYPLISLPGCSHNTVVICLISTCLWCALFCIRLCTLWGQARWLFYDYYITSVSR